MAKRIKHNKLVRDKIPNILIKKGKAFKCHTVTGQELQIALSCKVLEEAKEVNEAAQNFVIKGENTNIGNPPNARRNQLVGELADLMEATFALMKAFNISTDTVKKEMDYKANTRGKFNDGIYLEWVGEDE